MKKNIRGPVWKKPYRGPAVRFNELPKSVILGKQYDTFRKKEDEEQKRAITPEQALKLGRIVTVRYHEQGKRKKMKGTVRKVSSEEIELIVRVKAIKKKDIIRIL